MLERCMHASTHCVHTYEQTRLHAALGSDSVVTATLGFSEVKQFQFMWLQRGTWSPACHEKLARLPLSLILPLSVPSQQLLAGLGSEPLDCRQPPCLLYTNNLCSLKMVQGSRATLAINLPAKQTVAPQKHGLARPGGGGCWEGCEEEVGTPVRLAWNVVAEGKQALALKINHSHSQGRQREPRRGTNTHPLQ